MNQKRISDYGVGIGTMPKGKLNKITDVKGDIVFKDVSFSYVKGEKTILNHLDLHIPKGTNVALVGPSGGGKTTLCNLIPRFYEIESGDIFLDGKNREVVQ